MSQAQVAEKPAERRMAPGGDRVLVRPHEEGLDCNAFSEDVAVKRKGEDLVTEAGIVVPKAVEDQATRRSMIGTVLEVGPEVGMLFNTAGESRIIQAGDEVVYPYYPGHIVDRSPGLEDFVDCIIMSELDVLSIMEPV